MSKNLPKILFAIVVLGALGYFFYTKSQDNDSVVNSAVAKVTTDDMVADDLSAKYEKVPLDELFQDTPDSKAMLEELKERYKTNFEALVNEAKTTGTTLVFCWMTTEPEIKMQRLGRAFIEQLCRDNSVEFLDLNPSFDYIKDAKTITFMPDDGHFNARGSKLVADYLAKYVNKYTNAKSTATYSDAERSKLFGDMEPGLKNKIEDGGKNLPYKVTTNTQGLRMDYDLIFPKSKQRILLLGDSGFYSPFVDNAQTIAGQLQTMFPNKEILNAAIWGYGVDDYLSLFHERAKYAEPDVVFLQSSGEDISDLFFSQRLRMSRHKEKIQPTESEKKFYATLE